MVESNVKDQKNKRCCLLSCFSFFYLDMLTLQFSVNLSKHIFEYFLEVLKLMEEIPNVHFHNYNLNLKVDTQKNN